jgi:putative membrane protein
MGAIYGPLMRIVPLPAVLKGSVFGSVVWLAAYLGWLPAIGMSEAATKQPIQRNMLMIGAHLVWGAVLGGMMNLLESVFDYLIRSDMLKKRS